MKQLSFVFVPVVAVALLAACGSQDVPPTADPIIPVESPPVTREPVLLTPAADADADTDVVTVNETLTADELDDAFTINVAGASGEVGAMFASNTCTERGLRVTWTNNAATTETEGTLGVTLYFVIPPDSAPDNYRITETIQDATAELLGGAAVNTPRGRTYSVVTDGAVRLSRVPVEAGDTLAGTYEMTVGRAIADADAELDVSRNQLTLTGSFDYTVTRDCIR